MAQLHCYVPDEIAEQFHKKAKNAHLSVSKYLASLVKKEIGSTWPDDYFDLFGARYSQRVSANLHLLQRFFAPLVNLVFDDRCAEEYAQIRADLSAQGKIIGPNDMLIAAIDEDYHQSRILRWLFYNISRCTREHLLKESICSRLMLVLVSWPANYT